MVDNEREFEAALAAERVRASRRPAAQGKPEKKRPTATGHEAFLQMLTASKAPVIITFLDGTIDNGVIACSDKFTISIKKQSGGTRVIFKHAIKSFETNWPRPKELN